MALYPEIFMYLAPFVGVGLYLLAYAFWRFSVRFYKSTGN
jgi:ABC-2 type transport system permease protein